MKTKYVFEECDAFNTSFIGEDIIQRLLFDNYEDAQKYFEDYLLKKYETKEKVEEKREECSGNTMGDYLEDWYDEEYEVCIRIFDVNVYEKQGA